MQCELTRPIWVQPRKGKFNVGICGFLVVNIWEQICVELNPGQDPPRLASQIVLLYLSFLVCISAQEHPYNLLTRYSTLTQFFNASLHTQPSSLLPNPHCMGTSVLLRYCASLIEQCLFKSCIITLGLSSLQNYTTRWIMFEYKCSKFCCLKY